MSDALSVLSWWFLIQLIGLAAWPLAFRLLRFLPDRGYTAAKPLGLLLVSYGLWLLGSLGLVQNSVGGIVFVLVLVMAASVWALSCEGLAALRDWLRQHGGMVLVYEALWAAAMFGWAAYRATNPGINSTEKPMEFMFLNSILRSPSFPPQDAWLAGFGISYYYFGYVMMAVMTRLAGTLPGVAYNISHGLWFALIAGGAFGAAFQILGIKHQISKDAPPNKHLKSDISNLVFALLAAVFVVFLGNLEGTLELAHQNGIGSPEFWQWLDIKDISGPAETGGGIEPRRYMWWWRASRVVHDRTLEGGDQEVIDEFPFFSFLNGDLHPHTLGYPFVFLAISLALNVYSSSHRRDAEDTEKANQNLLTLGASAIKSLPLLWPELLLYAVCLGALGFLNTWDFPIYLFLVVAALAVRRWQEAGRLNAKAWTDAVVLGLVLGVAGVVLYLPFYIGFQSQARGISPNLFNGTSLPQFLVMFGQFALPGAFLLLALVAARVQVSVLRFWLGALGWTVVILMAAMLLTSTLEAIVALRALLNGEPVPGWSTPEMVAAANARLLQRLLDPWTALLLALSLVVVWKLLGQSVSPSTGEAQEGAPLTRPGVPFVMLMFFLGAALALSVEFVYLADTFGTRMNTVFKFYYQTWALWGVAAACVIGWMLEDAALWVPFRILTGVVTVLVMIASLVYPVTAISTVGDWRHPTLDGTAWMASSLPDDYVAIQWLNQSVSGTPVILEAPGESYRPELSRVSAFTGLPTVLGWPGHELQWRGDYVEAGLREPDVKKIYTTLDAQEALTLLDKYAISYVYVGSAERKFPAAGLKKLDAMMDVVFQQASVTIYRRK